MEGYETFGGGVPQVTNKGKQTNIKVLCPPGTPYKETKMEKRHQALYMILITFIQLRITYLMMAAKLFTNHLCIRRA